MLVVLLLAILASVQPGSAGWPAAQAATVIGDNQADAYLGRGGLLIQRGAIGDAARSAAATCDGCQWRVTTPCGLEDGSFPDSPDAPDCVVVPARCANGRDVQWLWRRLGTGAPWDRYGSMCHPDVPPVTRSAMESRLVGDFLRRIAPPAPVRQPGGRALVNIPVIFRSGGPGSPLDAQHSVAGFDVRLRATPSWTWSFGDGSALSTTRPGRSWPNIDISHTYRRPGQHQVRVAARWPATYTVDGLGPFDVPTVVTTEAGVTVRVVEARAVIVERG